MRYATVFAFAVLTTGIVAAAPAEPIRVELNAMENTQGRCRVSFVIENKAEAAVDALQLDLVLFNRGGVVQRRVATDLGPIRPAKTIVKTFNLDGACDEIGSVLVNEVAACAPADPNACLDRLTLSSRVEQVRFYK
jgi:hypothetical protein